MSLKDCSMFAMLTRIGCYLNGLLLIMFVTERWGFESFTTTLSLFTVFAFAFELLWAQRMKGARLGWYITCVVGLSLCGVYLAGQALQVQQENYARTVFRTRVQEAVSSVDGSVMVTTDKGIITAANDGVLKMTGYTRAELIGKSVTMLFPREGESHILFRQEASQQMHRNNDAGWVIRGGHPVQILTKDGRTIRVTKYIIGLRSSVDCVWPEDVQFITIFAYE